MFLHVWVWRRGKQGNNAQQMKKKEKDRVNRAADRMNRYTICLSIYTHDNSIAIKVVQIMANIFSNAWRKRGKERKK